LRQFLEKGRLTSGCSGRRDNHDEEEVAAKYNQRAEDWHLNTLLLERFR
jgi:hypothetical protein